MKAITLWEPWATFIAAGHKRYETRSWSTLFRGNIAIHASKRWQRDQKHILNSLVMRHPELADYAVYEFPFGCVVVACRLVAVHKTEAIRDSLTPLERALGDYSTGRFAWELEIIKLPEKPIPAQGMQGIWTWDYTGAQP
jgi:activating signal cointegrator 1